MEARTTHQREAAPLGLAPTVQFPKDSLPLLRGDLQGLGDPDIILHSSSIEDGYK